MGYAEIKNNNSNSKTTINKFQYISKKLVKTKSSIKFLLKCRKSRLIPNFIKNATIFNKLIVFDHDINRDIDSILDTHTFNYHTKILNLLIKHKHTLLTRQQQQLEGITKYLEKRLNTHDFEEFLKSEKYVTSGLTATLKKKQESKYERLKNEYSNILGDNKQDCFINKTKVDFPSDIKSLLAKGPKFALPIENKSFPIFKYIADGEELIQTHKIKEQQEEARTKLSLLIKEYRAKSKPSAIDRAIVDTVERTRKFLRQNDNIRILTSDKGNKTVAMEINDYNNKMNDILNNLTMYRVQRQDPTSRIQTKNNLLVDGLFKMGLISKPERNKMITTTALPPRIYGLPKIHKEGTPLRPICSTITSPSYGLCTYISNILKKLTLNSSYNVKNTIDFKEKINNTFICDDEKLISFDVVSLFPSIPTQLALDVIREKWTIIEEYTKIHRKMFMEIVKFCIEENRYFKFNDKIYTQLQGLPMGSPTSPIIADILMEKLLENSIEKLIQKPRSVAKYVDDIFAIVKETEVQNTLDVLNSFDRHIKFTMEFEDGKLPYLDSLSDLPNQIAIIAKKQKLPINQ
ncbi:uncharacterized protein [Eurosta solidaginis]|uniref:uncharacterized protein n=1 Tax=Eurosta solidaginis TaxID=178769 RepID=UPI00353096C5